MTNGIIYPALKYIIDKIRYLNLVELFKYFIGKYNPRPDEIESRLKYTRMSVDIFIICKWILVLIFQKCHWDNNFCVFMVWYLLLTNIYSYFHYHIWSDEALYTENFQKDRIRRRFIYLILALCFSNVCFAYLYQNPYSSCFDWGGESQYIKSIWYSFSNSLAANYIVVKPITDFGHSISMIQLLITFIFITIMLGRSIPQTNPNT